MVFSNAQQTAFFTDNDQMGLSARTRAHLATEGINHPVDLAEFVEEDSWKQILENCKRPPQIPDPAGGGGLVNQQPFQLPARSLMRLKVASRVAEYYQQTNRALSAANMTWVRLGNFHIEWKVIQDKKRANDELSLPVISKQLAIVAFFEAYETYCQEFIGAANCPLSWIYRETVVVAGATPTLKADQPYSEAHGSVAGEMVNRLPHIHPLYRVDNATGFSQLVTATMGTQYSSTIAPFKRSRNGRGALEALKAQFAGPAYWDKTVRTMNDFIINMKWTGTTSFTLHGFLAKHRASFNTLQRCAEHVSVELPNERTRVGYLIENIDCQDKDVTTAVSHVRLDDSVDATGNPSGMRNDFERAVAFLLPMDPVGKKRRAKRPAAQISAAATPEVEVGAAAVADPKKGKKGRKVTFKPTCGKTGVEFRYYKPAEFSKLTDEQRAELKEHRMANGNYKGPWKGKQPSGDDKGGSHKPNKGGVVNKRVVAALMREVKEDKKKEQEEYEVFKDAIINELRGEVLALKSSTQASTPPSSSPPIKRILKRASTVASAIGAEATTSDSLATETNAQEEEMAELAANKLYAKFKAIGSKAKRKTG